MSTYIYSKRIVEEYTYYITVVQYAEKYGKQAEVGIPLISSANC